VDPREDGAVSAAAPRLGALLALILGATGAGAQGQAPGPQALVLACEGAFARDSSLARLRETFGRENVTTEQIYVGEGESEPGAVVYPKDPARRVEVLWADGRRQARPSAIRVRGDASRWRTPSGVGVGSTLVEVERLNGRPFVVLGFGWDLGGSAGDWKGGRLAEAGASGCHLGLSFETGASADPKALDAVQGDRAFSSSDPKMRAAKPSVHVITLTLRQNAR